MDFLVNERKPFLQNVILLLLKRSVLRGRILKAVKKKNKNPFNQKLFQHWRNMLSQKDTCEDVRFCVRRFLFLSLPATFLGHRPVSGQCKYRTSTELLLSQLYRALGMRVGLASVKLLDNIYILGRRNLELSWDFQKGTWHRFLTISALELTLGGWSPVRSLETWLIRQIHQETHLHFD